DKLPIPVDRRETELCGEFRDLSAGAVGQRIFQNEQTGRPDLGGGLDPARHLTGGSRFEDLKTHMPAFSGCLDAFICEPREWSVRVHQHRDPLFAWQEFLKELQPLASKVARLVGETRYISAGAAEARHQTCTYGVADGREYDGYGRGRCLRRLRRERPESRNQQLGQPFWTSHLGGGWMTRSLAERHNAHQHSAYASRSQRDEEQAAEAPSQSRSAGSSFSERF